MITKRRCHRSPGLLAHEERYLVCESHEPEEVSVFELERLCGKHRSCPGARFLRRLSKLGRPRRAACYAPLVAKLG